MGYIYSIQTPDNTTHLIEPLLFATAGGISTALTAGINNFTLVAGAYVNIKVGEVGSNATLNISNTGAKDIYYNNMQISADMLTPNNIYTFIYDGLHWNVLGDITGIYNSDNITAGSSDEPTWISKITQATDGSIQVERKTIEVLPIAHGGTGVTSFSPNQIILSTNPNENDTMTFTSRAYSDSTSAEALGNASTNFVTERDIYYGLPQINHNHNYNSDTDLYVPLNSGDNGQILISRGLNTEPIWSIAATLNSNTESIADTAAYTTLTLGNNTNVNSAAAHSEGKIVLYSAATKAHTIIGASTDTEDYTHILPNDEGWLVSANSNGVATGGKTLIYIANTGVATASTQTEGGEKQPVYLNAGTLTALQYTANRLYYSASTTSFEAGTYYANGTGLAINKTSLTTDYTFEVNGDSNFNGNIIPTLSTDSTPVPNKTLGSSDNRWAKLYIGNADNHGDAYTPIYWKDGIPTVVTPVQYCTFTINSGTTGVRLSHNAFTENSYVLQIVVTSGEANLNSAINWESFTGYINLTCTTTSGSVSGYILVSRGGAPSQVASEDLPLAEET